MTERAGAGSGSLGGMDTPLCTSTRPRRLALTIGLLAAAALTTAAPTPVRAAPPAPPPPAPVVDTERAVRPVPAVPAYARPCRWEDGSWCTWDAKHRGNGRGHSFVARGRTQPVRYVTHRRAHRLVARWRAAQEGRGVSGPDGPGARRP